MTISVTGLEHTRHRACRGPSCKPIRCRISATREFATVDAGNLSDFLRWAPHHG